MQMRIRLLFEIFAFAITLAFIGLARADDPRPRVVLITTEAPGEFADRIHVELRAAGFEIIDAPQNTDASDFGSVAQSHNARALVRVRLAGVVDVWIRDRGAPKSIEGSFEDVESMRLGALRVTEFLRAGLLDVAPKPPAPAIPTFSKDTHFSVLARAGIIASPGGFGVSTLGGLEGTWAPRSRLSASIFAWAPFTAATLETVEGTTRFRPVLAGAAVLMRFAPDDAAWQPYAGVAAAALAVFVTGASASSSVASRSDAAFAWVPMVRAGVGYRASTRWRLSLDALTGWVTPKPVIAFGDKSLATWGEPFVGGSLGAGWAW